MLTRIGHSHKNDSGFTMLEMSFVLLVIAILMTSIINFIVFGNLIVTQEKGSYLEKEKINIITKSIIKDLYDIKSLHVDNKNDVDILMYETIDGEILGYKFKDDGMYTIENNKEEWVSRGKKIDSNKDAVYIDKNLIVFNYYFDNANILWDFAFRPRFIEVKNNEK